MALSSCASWRPQRTSRTSCHALGTSRTCRRGSPCSCSCRSETRPPGPGPDHSSRHRPSAPAPEITVKFHDWLKVKEIKVKSLQISPYQMKLFHSSHFHPLFDPPPSPKLPSARGPPALRPRCWQSVGRREALAPGAGELGGWPERPWSPQPVVQAGREEDGTLS